MCAGELPASHLCPYHYHCAAGGPPLQLLASHMREAVARPAVTWRSLLLVTVLAPLNCYWVVMMEEVRYSGHPTTVSLFFNVIFCILLLRGANQLLLWKAPRWALSQGELLVVYTCLSIASGLAAHDSIQMLAPAMAAPFWYATPENKWQELFLSDLPMGWVVRDMKSLDALFSGGTTPYTVAHLAPWGLPVLHWCVYMVVMLLVFLCMNVLIRKQWTERERLSYPLIVLPLQLTEPRGLLFRNRLLWIGFALAAGIDLLNGLNVLYPSLPMIRVRVWDVSQLIKTRPWRAIGWTPISFYPFAIGLGYLLPQDQLFSCWFFFFWWKALRVMSSVVGLEPQAWTASAPPYLNEQAFGGYMGLFAFSLWAMRAHLGDIWRQVKGEHRPAPTEGFAEDPLPIPVAFWGMVAGFAVLVGMVVHAGASLPVAVAYFTIFFILGVVVTRIRAELGHPVHDLHFAGPDLIIPQVVGTANLGKRDLAVLSILFWQNRAYRNHEMPHQLEGFRMAEEVGFDRGRFALAMILASAVGAVGSFWGWLDPAFRMGVGAKWTGAARNFGRQPYQRLQQWLTSPQGPAWGPISAMGVGFVSVLALFEGRARFTGWPFHPIGYAVSGSWAMNCLWLPLLIAWTIKAVILRYGRAKMYRAAMPLFIGLVLGEFFVGSVWTLIGIFRGVPTYGFWV